MYTLYPDIQPLHEYFLDVGEGHQLYVEECGNPNGIPVLFIHGGPGGSISVTHRRFFNPERYRIILFDQRGCGRSTPHASLEHNTTQALIGDIERIRHFLGIEQWLLFGGSWGSTLSLLYAETHPSRVLGMILRGIFLGRDQDIEWLYQKGASALFPDFWQDYLAPIPQEEQGDLVKAYYQRLTSDNELIRMSAAKAWSVWEGRCSTLDPKPDVVEHFSEPHIALAMARIEAHFFINKNFIKPNQVLDNAHRLHKIPTVLVHGRYDVICPLEQAFALRQHLPQAELHIVRDAGHSAFEPGIIDNLVRATDTFSVRLA